MKKKLLLASSLLFMISPVRAVQPDDDTTFMSLTRSPEPLDQLPTNVEVISRADIEKSGAQSMADLLDYATSINVGRSGSLGSSAFVRIRGVPSSNQVQVLINDQPIGGSSIQNINVNLLPIDNIERIEIVRGNASVLYGANSVGGLIRIITRKDTKPWSAGYAMEAGSFDTTIQRANAGAKLGQLGFSVRGTKSNSDGYQDNSDVDDRTVGGTFAWNLKNGGYLEFAMDNTKRDLGTPSGTPVKIPDWDGQKEKQATTPDERIANDLTLGRLSASIPLTLVKLDSSFYGSRELYKVQIDRQTDPMATYDNRIFGNDTHVTFLNGAILGASFERDARYSSSQNYATLEMADQAHNISNTGFYAQAPLRANNTTIIPAIRYDHHSAFGSELNPRVSVVTKVTDKWRVTGNVARSHRNPTLVDLYENFPDPFDPGFDFFGNPNLRPEKSWGYDIGTDLTLSNGLYGAITGFRNEITDRIISVDTDGNGFVDTVQNISQAEIQGIETQLKAITGPMTHSFNYTFQEARGTAAGGTDLIPLRLTPTHTINYVSDLEPIEKLHLINVLEYVSDQYANDNYQGVKLPCYTVWNAQIRNTWGPLTVYGKVDNITNRRYAESVTFGSAVPQPVRAYYGGASLQF